MQSGSFPVGSTFRRLGPAQSPVVSAFITRRDNAAKASSALRRTLMNGSGILVLFIDWYFCVSSYLLHGSSLMLLQYAEIFGIMMLALSCIHDLTLYFGLNLPKPRVKITSSQCKKLGISTPGSAYELISTPEPFGEAVHPSPTSSHTPSSPHRHAYPSPANSSYSSRHSTPHNSFTGQSPNNPSNTRIYRNSPFSGEPVVDSRSLDRYLQQEEDKLLQGSVDPFSTPQSSPATGSGVYGGNPTTQSPSPRKYHIAPRTSSPSSPSGDFDSPQYGGHAKPVDGCGIKKKDMDLWTERCRKWIALTILKPLANEINIINSTLNKKGKSEQIGMVPLDVLKRLSIQATPTLPMVIQYLDLSTKQEYLVERIKELGSGSYMSVYCWDAGGSWKGRPWTIDLPSDSQIIMHLLSTYLDSHLPPDPWFPNGKTFSTQYFLKTVPKNVSKQQSVCLVQSNSSPPVYKVLIKGKYINVAEGRNNLFHCICTFLHHVKTNEESMLGTINLETAGINILSIISPSKS